MTIKLIDAIIGLFFTISGGVMGILVYRKNEKKDLKHDTTERVRHDTEIVVKLDNIAKNVDEIRLDNKEFSKSVNKLNERVSTVETKVEGVEQRIDSLEKLHFK